jgi:hypothetical protein
MARAGQRFVEGDQMRGGRNGGLPECEGLSASATIKSTPPRAAGYSNCEKAMFEMVKSWHPQAPID